MQNVDWFGYRTWSHIDVAPVAFRHACQYAEIASKRVTIRRMTSICFCRKRAVPVTAATHRS